MASPISQSSVILSIAPVSEGKNSGAATTATFTGTSSENSAFSGILKGQTESSAKQAESTRIANKSESGNSLPSSGKKSPVDTDGGSEVDADIEHQASSMDDGAQQASNASEASDSHTEESDSRSSVATAEEASPEGEGALPTGESTSIQQTEAQASDTELADTEDFVSSTQFGAEDEEGLLGTILPVPPVTTALNAAGSGLGNVTSSVDTLGAQLNAGVAATASGLTSSAKTDAVITQVQPQTAPLSLGESAEALLTQQSDAALSKNMSPISILESSSETPDIVMPSALLRAAAMHRQADPSAASVIPSIGGYTSTGELSLAGDAKPLPGYSLNSTPTDPEFPSEFVNRMQMMMRNGIQVANLNLNPNDLGQVKVTITTEGDKATVSFIADNAAAKESIEQSMPKLREMLEQSGLQLMQGDVSQQKDGQGQLAESDRLNGRSDSQSDETEIMGAIPSNTIAIASNTMVDYYI